MNLTWNHANNFITIHFIQGTIGTECPFFKTNYAIAKVFEADKVAETIIDCEKITW